ncbi:hypothetical protein CSKR_200620 [Clonorchis sinensis]|uniref:Uncharacterized protein n=1 Tax=Clonorchis sinensis TaxID=79923 RepID=A0A8T1MGN9_CLOSI|nr:hypothetical protein CSKR_200620 [Clonorchis sinensis]
MVFTDFYYRSSPTASRERNSCPTQVPLARNRFPWLDTTKETQPLATSTQLGFVEGQSVTQHLNAQLGDEDAHLYITQEWQLERYSRLHPTNSADGERMDTTDGENSNHEDEWETWEGGSAPALVVRLAGFGHLCIMYGTELVESYFLILAKRWMKAVLVDDEVMIMAKKISQTARLRLSFKNSNDAKNFFAALGRFAKCKENGPPAAQTDPVSERVEDILSTPAPLPQAWNTEWPTQSLEGLVRLCLSDPNFPGFVRRVDSIMKKLTSKATSLD